MWIDYRPIACSLCNVVFTPTNSLVRHCSLLCKLVDYCDRSGGDDACWEWTKCRHPKGYGLLTQKGKPRAAHRAMYECIHEVDLPWEIVVRHKCDNPPCINPNHLEIGTRKDNNDDKMKRGRYRGPQSGEDHANAVLTNEVALAIYNAEGRAEDIARKFDTNISTVTNIRTGRWWKGVTGGIPRQKARRKDCRLTDQQVVEIFQSNEKGVVLAEQYDVTAALISQIRNRCRFVNVTKDL